MIEQAKDAIFAALNLLDAELGLTPKEKLPSAPAVGDVYMDPIINGDVDESGNFLLQCSVIVILSTNWDIAYTQVDSWLDPLCDALRRALFIQRFNTVTLQLPGADNGRPALVLTGVRE